MLTDQGGAGCGPAGIGTPHRSGWQAAHGGGGPTECGPAECGPAECGPAECGPTTRRFRARRGQRGVALVMVLAMVVFLSAFVVEFAYTSRVDYLQAAHYRDGVKAHYLAKSGVRIYTLFMAFIQQMANDPMIQSYSQMIGMNIDDKLWQQVPFIDTAFLRFGMAGDMNDLDEDEFDMAALQQGRMEFEIDTKTQEKIDKAIERDETALTRSFLAFEGDFRAEINDEDGKINLNSLKEGSAATIQTSPIALAIYGLMQDQRYDEMFEERNEYERWEVLANIKDFIDADNEQSTAMGGYEDSLYDDDDKWGRNYKPKNLAFDTLDEVQLVAGVTDEVYLTFGPQWTIYGNNKINITTCNDALLYGLIWAFADRTVSEEVIREALTEIQMMKMFGSLTTDTFVSTIKAKGITLTDEAGLKSLIKTNSRVFTILSTGYVGDVESNIETVIEFNGGRFKMLSWKEQ